MRKIKEHGRDKFKMTKLSLKLTLVPAAFYSSRSSFQSINCESGIFIRDARIQNAGATDFLIPANIKAGIQSEGFTVSVIGTLLLTLGPARNIFNPFDSIRTLQYQVVKFTWIVR